MKEQNWETLLIKIRTNHFGGNSFSSRVEYLLIWTSLQQWKLYTLVSGFIISLTGNKGSSESPVHTYNLDFPSFKSPICKIKLPKNFMPHGTYIDCSFDINHNKHDQLTLTKGAGLSGLRAGLTFIGSNSVHNKSAFSLWLAIMASLSFRNGPKLGRPWKTHLLCTVELVKNLLQ